MSLIRQIVSVAALNVRSIPHRFGTSSVIVIGIAGVVAVLLSVLAMATGILHTMSTTGRPDRAIVLRAGSTAELNSSLSRDAALTILDAPGVKHDANGKAIGSAESLTLMDIPTENGTSWANVAVRGVGPQVQALRPEMHFTQGRMFRPAVHEFIVGAKANSQFDSLKLGRQVKFANGQWTIVGVFESAGDGHESEVLADADTMMSAVRRTGYQPMTVLLDSPDRFEAFKTALTTNPALSVDVKRESDYFAEAARPIGRILSVVAYVVGGIMAIGALFGALNTMYSAVSARTVEIATLRALGFGSGAVVVSVFAEALLLSLVGGALGCLLAVGFFDGHVISSSVAGNGISQLVFALAVTPGLIAVGIIWACFIGLVGGLFPALRAARLPVATALRAV